MKALQFSSFGEPADVLKLVDLIQKPLAENEVRVQIEAAALNPADVVNVMGRFPPTVLPRVPGRDFSGTIVAGPREMIGWKVWGSGGELGTTRDGANAEYVDIPANAVSRPPREHQRSGSSGGGSAVRHRGEHFRARAPAPG
jgi:NADPH:quinone reductase